jgi:hypothetical protein
MRTAMAHRPLSVRNSNSARLGAPLPELTSLMYLDILAGRAVEHVAAKYGLRSHVVAERIEAARLCYERQVDMPGFPLHLL